MISNDRIEHLPYISYVFNGSVPTLFRQDDPEISLIVYATHFGPEEDEEGSALGVLDRTRNLYFEVSFCGETIVNCRKYTPDYFSHGFPILKFKELYFDLLCQEIPSSIRRRLLGLFLPDDQGVNRHVGGFFVASQDDQGGYRERCLEVENRYL